MDADCALYKLQTDFDEIPTEFELFMDFERYFVAVKERHSGILWIL